MLVTAVVLPHPPLLVPAVAAGAAHELDELRAACLDALELIRRSGRDGCEVVVVGGGERRETFMPGAVGSFADFGVPLAVTLPGTASPQPVSGRMPLSLSAAAWLMQQTGTGDWSGGPVRAESVPFGLSTAAALELGRTWADSIEHLALVVMGDGSSALSTKAPGYLVPGAEQWQSKVTAALADADLEVLASLLEDDAQRFGAAGRTPWQVLAGAAGAAGAVSLEGRLLAVEDRYGVAYVVAQWSAAVVDA